MNYNVKRGSMLIKKLVIFPRRCEKVLLGILTYITKSPIRGTTCTAVVLNLRCRLKMIGVPTVITFYRTTGLFLHSEKTPNKEITVRQKKG